MDGLGLPKLDLPIGTVFQGPIETRGAGREGFHPLAEKFFFD